MKVLQKLNLKFILTGVFAVIFLALIWIPQPVQASLDDKKVYDDGDLLNDGEEQQLEELCRKYGKKSKLDIVIVTMNDSSLPDCEIYLEDLYDSKKFGFDQEFGDTVMIVVDLARRNVAIQGYKKAETYLAQDRGDIIRNKITPDLTAGNYSDAFEQYIKLSAEYFKIHPSISPNNPILQLWFQLLLAVIIGAVIVAIMAANAGTKMTAGGTTYLDPSNSKVLGRYDRYIRTTTTKVRKPQESSGGGGGGGGGISSGGNSHSSSRGSF